MLSQVFDALLYVLLQIQSYEQVALEEERNHASGGPPEG